MNKFYKSFYLVVLLSLNHAHAFTYQGELSQSGNLFDGNADLKFSLFDSQTNGNMVGNEDSHNNIVINQGRFVVELSQWMNEFNGTEYWLEISAAIPAGSGNFTTLTPRQKLGSVPYAEYTYNLNVNGLQLRINGTCDSDSAIRIIDQSGSVTCSTFAAVNHAHAFSEITSIPTDLADGDDDTTYSGSDFAISNQNCSVGKVVSGIAANGTLICVDLIVAPPNCDGANQVLQYNSTTGWACVNINDIGASSGNANGGETLDSWGYTWDTEERTATTWAIANQTCENINARLPTITELYRVSGAFKDEIGNTNSTNYIWSRTWWNDQSKARVRLADGGITNSSLNNQYNYRCLWPNPSSNSFSGNQCMGEPGDECWQHSSYPSGKVNIDKMERPAVSYVAATDECNFNHAHLAHQQDYAENAISGLPNGSNDYQWTSDSISYRGVGIVRWSGTNTNYFDYGSNQSWDIKSSSAHKFRCAGVNFDSGAYPTTLADEFIASSTQIKVVETASSLATFANSVDGCFNQGGHIAHSRDIMELARAGMEGNNGDYIWLSDRSEYRYTQIAKWTGVDTSYSGYYPEYENWGQVDSSTSYQHRCVFYPIDNNYSHPIDSQCASAAACQTYDNGVSKFAIDATDRSASTYMSAMHTCLNNGARLPSALQLTEAIRAGLDGGATAGFLWTSDSANEGDSYSTALRWSGVDNSYSPTNSNNATWIQKTNIYKYRCVWSNQLW